MGFFDKIKAGLTKTRDALSDSLSGLFSGGTEIDDDFYDELEESLILADLGVETAAKATAALRKTIRERHITTAEEARSALKEILTDMVSVGSAELDLSTTPSVVLVIGVNGVGKTTTIGKIAKQLCDEGKKVLLVAGDTFRAAAADQLEIWAERSGADIVRQHEGADPASVVYDGIQSAKTKGVDVIIIDTAGRLHNKTNLMNEPGGAAGAGRNYRPERSDPGQAVQGNRRGNGSGGHQAGWHGQGRYCYRRGGYPGPAGEIHWRWRKGRGPDALPGKGLCGCPV